MFCGLPLGYKTQGKFVRVLLLDLSTFILPISLCIDLCPVFLLIKDREFEKLRIEAEKLKIEAARKDKEMEIEKEIALKKIEAEVELKKIEAETTSHPWGPKEKSSNPRSPKLPYFDEHTDKMDSYLTRFESYALSNKWDPSMWASYLSALLTLSLPMSPFGDLRLTANVAIMRLGHVV